MRQKEPASRPLKVVHLATTSYGGAGKAAYRLHLGLRASGIDSTMLVADRRGEEPGVRVLPSGLTGAMVDGPAGQPPNLLYMRRLWEHWMRRVAQYSPPPLTELFTDDYSEIELKCVREIRDADIVNLHWIPGVVNWLDAAVALKGKKVVWTMHDMNPFTGGCHYSGDCARYRMSCGSCPILASKDAGDISHSSWLSKKYAFQRLDLHPVAPSRWLARCASTSSLMSGLQTTVIPYGFPTDRFRPDPRRGEVRARYGVPAGAKVVLCGAESLLNQRKGFSYLLRALQGMRRKDIVLAAFGELPDQVQLSLGLPVIKLGFVKDETALAAVYSMADLFVIPSIEDNLPNTVVEAMLCGLPVAGFDTGGIPDMIRHRETGYLAPARDCRALAEGIEWCLFSENAAGLGERACRRAHASYPLEAQAGRYISLYSDLLASGDRKSPLPPSAEKGPGHDSRRQEPAIPPPVPASDGEITSIVVVTADEEGRTRGCLESIGRNTPEPHEVIVVDNRGRAPFLRSLCAARENWRLIETGSGTGFTAACNTGLNQAAGKRIVLLAGDAVVTAGWLAGMLACLEREPGAGMVGPMTGAAPLPQGVAAPCYRDIPGLEAFARSFAARNAGRRFAVERLAGFCLLLTRELAAAAGAVDERFGSDDFAHDYALRAALAGFGAVIAADVFIHHWGSASRRRDRKAARAATGRRAPLEGKWDLALMDETPARQFVTHAALFAARQLVHREECGAAVDLLLDRGIRFSPQNPQPYRELARILMSTGNFKEALEVLEGAPGGEEAASLLLAAHALNGLGDRHKAEEVEQRLLLLSPHCAELLHLRGTLAAARGDQAQAEDFLRRGIAADPGFGPCYTALAGILWQRGRRDEGVQLAGRGFILSPLDMKALSRYHEYAVLMQTLPAEEARVREALELFPGHRGLAYAIIDLLLWRGRYSEAMEEIERAAARFGMDDAMIDAALEVRRLAGPLAAGEQAPCEISACFVVRNEARQLPAALASVKKLAQEVVVVDTGSSDRTRDIARVFGARLFEFPWNDDFSEARNFSLSQATGRWIFIFDPDELLHPGDVEPLKALVAGSADPVAYSLPIRNYTQEITRQDWRANAGEYPDEERGVGWTPCDRVRLFPNDPRIRFEGAVHELLEPSIVRCGIPIRACDVPVHHYGKLDPAKLAEKQEHYYLLGLKKLEESGSSTKPLAELALQATELGYLQEAEKLWLRLLEALPEDAEAHFNLGYVQLALGNHAAARASASRAVELAPEMKEARFNLGKCHFLLGEIEAALAAGREMIERWGDYPPALSLLGASYLVLGQKEEAHLLVGKLRRLNFDCGDFLNDYARGLAQGGRKELAAPLVSLAAELAAGAALP